MALAERLKIARQNSGLKQQEVSRRCGIDDSSLSAFENGRSEPRLAQLEKLADVYHLPLSFFFEKSELKTPVVMWREKPEHNRQIQAEFLQLCRQYRQLEIWMHEVHEKTLPVVEVCQEFWYPHVEELASDTRKIMGLGQRPGESLYRLLEEVYGVKIFHLDLGRTGTAACAVSEEFGEAILLNNRCTRWRQNHDIAHELFHLRTWKHFRHAEGICDPSVQEEKFATCFAGNILLPTQEVRTAISKAADRQGRIPLDRLDRIAREFDVSLESLFWRMHFLYSWDETKTKRYIEQAKQYVKTARRQDDFEPPLFPERYRALAIKALHDGEISLGRFAKFMKISRTEAQHYITGREPDYAEVPTSAA